MAAAGNRLKKIRTFIFDQFEDSKAQAELKKLGPKGIDWPKRTRSTLEALIPRLPMLADHLVKAVPRNLNSSVQVYEQIKQGETHLADILKSNAKVNGWYRELLAHSERAKLMIGTLESQQISSEIQRIIVSPDGLGDLLRVNGGSIYPDLIVGANDYSALPKQSRSNPIDGPCLRGKNPSNVPDGCEVKTNQGNRIKVDAHGAHCGLHLGVTWDLDEKQIQVTGVWAGYVRFADHRESRRNVTVTTVKYSFGHDLFTSLTES